MTTLAQPHRNLRKAAVPKNDQLTTPGDLGNLWSSPYYTFTTIPKANTPLQFMHQPLQVTQSPLSQPPIISQVPKRFKTLSLASLLLSYFVCKWHCLWELFTWEYKELYCQTRIYNVYLLSMAIQWDSLLSCNQCYPVSSGKPQVYAQVFLSLDAYHRTYGNAIFLPNTDMADQPLCKARMREGAKRWK